MQQKKGLFITVEGPEGGGKSTQIAKLTEYLKSKGHDVLLTREPGGTNCPIAEKIRALILDPSNTGISSRCEAYLYAASRAQHVDTVIRPALLEGKTVISDRFVLSSVVYQGIGRNLGPEEIYSLNEFAMGDCIPNAHLIYDILPSKGLARIMANSNREYNRLDMEKLEFHEKVRQGYLDFASKNPDMVKIINADQDVESVFEDAKKILDSLMN